MKHQVHCYWFGITKSTRFSKYFGKAPSTRVFKIYFKVSMRLKAGRTQTKRERDFMDFSASPVSSQPYWTNWIMCYSYFNDRAYNMIRRITQIEKGAITLSRNLYNSSWQQSNDNCVWCWLAIVLHLQYFHVPNILIISSKHLPVTRQFQNMIWCYVLAGISQKVVV